MVLSECPRYCGERNFQFQKAIQQDLSQISYFVLRAFLDTPNRTRRSFAVISRLKISWKIRSIGVLILLNFFSIFRTASLLLGRYVPCKLSLPDRIVDKSFCPIYFDFNLSTIISLPSIAIRYFPWV